MKVGCNQWFDRLLQYTGDELSCTERAEVEMHIRECPLCAERLSKLCAAESCLSEVINAPVVAPDLTRDIMAQLPTPSNHPNLRWRYWAFSAAAALAGVAAMYIGCMIFGPTRPAATAKKPNVAIVRNHDKIARRAATSILPEGNAGPNAIEKPHWHRVLGHRRYPHNPPVVKHQPWKRLPKVDKRPATSQNRLAELMRDPEYLARATITVDTYPVNGDGSASVTVRRVMVDGKVLEEMRETTIAISPRNHTSANRIPLAYVNEKGNTAI